MINKSLILNRIKEHEGFTTDVELATFLGISKSTLSNWYSRNSIDYDLVFSKCEHINKDWLISGKGSTAKSEEAIQEVPEKIKSNVIPIDFARSVETIDIPIVEIYAAAGYGAFNSDYVEQSGSITLPASMVKRGKHYCVRIEGHSMSPTIQDSDYVIVRLLDPYDWKDMPDEHVYLVVDREGAAYMKRVKNRFEKGFIVCTSDSIEKNVYPSFNLQADHIANIFHAEWHLSAKMQNINETYYSRLKMLEDDMSEVKEYLKRIK